METAHKSATTNGGRSDEERRQWREEFDAAARRPLALRLKYAADPGPTGTDAPVKTEHRRKLPFEARRKCPRWH